MFLFIIHAYSSNLNTDIYIPAIFKSTHDSVTTGEVQYG